MELFWSDITTDALARSVTFMGDFKAVIAIGLGLAIFGALVLIFRGGN